MDDTQIEQILRGARTIASVGLSSDRNKPSYPVAVYLKRQGYRVIPVNPRESEVLGEKAYPNLEAIPDKVDVVQIFRRPEDVPPHVDEAIRIGAGAVWMQLGITSEQAAEQARAAGIPVVMDRCMKIEHHRLVGRPVSVPGLGD